jgi:hypothetical protein
VKDEKFVNSAGDAKQIFDKPRAKLNAKLQKLAAEEAAMVNIAIRERQLLDDLEAGRRDYDGAEIP